MFSIFQNIFTTVLVAGHWRLEPFRTQEDRPAERRGYAKAAATGLVAAAAAAAPGGANRPLRKDEPTCYAKMHAAGSLDRLHTCVPMLVHICVRDQRKYGKQRNRKDTFPDAADEEARPQTQLFSTAVPRSNGACLGPLKRRRPSAT